MDEDVVIEVDSVSKKFCKDPKKSMFYGVLDIGRNMLGVCAESDKLRDGEFWAVDDISFTLKKGECLGVIGRNGSGKSTLLKMLSGIVMPDKGQIKIRGRVGALIEVGAGFHPMLTGRENIYINAAILGMTKKEVDEKFDDIVKFADIGDFIDTPVKYYSSGMYARLGFSVSVHCEPDILLVDEVLSVGDLAFAIKCNRKLSEIRQSGKTVIIVSHNMQAIRYICDKVLWLSNGVIKAIGNTQTICDQYEKEIINKGKKMLMDMGKIFNYDSSVNIVKVEFLNKDNEFTNEYSVVDCLKIRIHYVSKRRVEKPIFIVSIFNSEGFLFSSNYSISDEYKIDSIYGEGYVEYCLDRLGFKPGIYICSIVLSEKEVANTIEWHEKMYVFTISGKSFNFGFINPFPRWYLNSIEYKNRSDSNENPKGN